MGRQKSIEVISKSEFVTIGELVRLTNARYSTLKFYTQEGLFTFEPTEENLTRRYNREDSIKRIEKIKKLKLQGLSISQIKGLLN